MIKSNLIKGTSVCDRLRSSPSPLRKLDRRDRHDVADNVTFLRWLIEKNTLNKLFVGTNMFAKRITVFTNNDRR
jgi:hypothetical protein